MAERWDEAWARRCIAAALRVDVEVHDDGSQPSMHDLNIKYANRPSGAVEVTAAADPAFVETWKLATGGDRWIESNIAGGWMAVIAPGSSVLRLREYLPVLLAEFEASGVRDLRPERWWEPDIRDEALRSLGVLHLFQSGTNYPGSIYLNVDPGQYRTSGRVPADGRPLIDWIDGWLSRPDQGHNLRKLAASGADERHLFLILPEFGEAPFQVTDLLMRDESPLPDEAPALPPEVTHVWAVSTWVTGAGMRWSADAGWSRFDKAPDDD